VDLTETAIVVALGKPVRTITEPGLKFKIPFYHQVTFFDKRYLDYDAPARDVISKRVYIETMGEVLSNTEKIILDTKTAGSVLPYLSLDRIRQSRGGGSQ